MAKNNPFLQKMQNTDAPMAKKKALGATAKPVKMARTGGNDTVPAGKPMVPPMKGGKKMCPACMKGKKPSCSHM